MHIPNFRELCEKGENSVHFYGRTREMEKQTQSFTSTQMILISIKIIL